MKTFLLQSKSELLENLFQTGGLAALPYMSRFVFWTIFSAITDSIHARKLMSITRLRKTMSIFCKLYKCFIINSPHYRQEVQ
jgi:hypothetical protein